MRAVLPSLASNAGRPDESDDHGKLKPHPVPPSVVERRFGGPSLTRVASPNRATQLNPGEPALTRVASPNPGEPAPTPGGQLNQSA